MIDPKDILAACTNAHQFGQEASSAMAQPFISSVPDMSTASPSNASNVIGGVQQVGAQMLANMMTIKSAVDQQVMAHQDAQQRQKSYDFNADMRDLRPTNAVGFPGEMPSNFFAPFKTGR